MGQSSEELLLKISGDSTGGQRSIADLQTQLKAAQKDVDDIQKAFAGVGPGSNGAQVFQEQLDAAKGKVAALSQELERAKKPADDTTQTWKEMASAFTSAGTAMHSTGAILTAAITAPLVGAALAGEHFAADFQTQMTRVQTLAGASAAEVKAMRGEVLNLGPAVGIGPAELAKGLFVLESAGQRGKAALETLTVAGKMSAIGMGETSEVARGLVGVMLSYQQQNLSAAEAGDILTKTVQLGNMKIDELVPALARVNPLAAAMGIKFQDVAAAIATFTHMGASSEVAATGLRAILSNILNDSAKTEKGFALLSHTLGDTSISMTNFRNEITEKGLAQALIDLMEKANAAGEKGMESLNKIFPNIKALTEVLANAKANGTMYLAVTEDMYRANGTLNDSFQETTKTWAYQWDQMKAKAEVMWIALGDQLLPVFSKVVAFVSDDVVPAFTTALKIFGDLPDAVKVAAIGIGGFAALAGPGLIFMGSLANAIGGVIRLYPLIADTQVVVTGLGLLQGAMVAVQGSAIALGIGLGALTVGGIAVAGLALYDLKLLWDNNAQAVKNASDESDRAARAIAAAMQIVGGPVKDEAEALQILNTRAKELREAQLGVKAATVTSAQSHLAGAAAAKTLADQVHALTEEQKADILSKREQHESIKAIAKETGIAADVVSMFLAQQKDGTKETKAWTEAMREYNSVGIDFHDTIAGMDAATVDGIKYDLARGQSQKVLQLIYGVTAEQIHAIIAAEKEDEKQLQETIKNIEYFRGVGEKAAAGIGKSLGGQRNVLTNLMFQTNDPDTLPPFAGKQVSNASLMPLAPDLSWLAKQNMDSYRTTLTDGMGSLFQKDLPGVILSAVQGGGNVLGAVGSALGGTMGKNLGTMLSTNLGSTLGKGLGSIMGPLGAIAGQAIGPLFDKITSFFKGGEEAEKVNQPRQQFIDAAGGLAALNQKMMEATGSISLVQRLLNAKTEKDYKTAVDAITTAVGAFDQKMKDAGTVLGGVSDKMTHLTSLSPELQKALEKAYNAKTVDDYNAALKTVNGILDDQASKQQALDATLQKYGMDWTELGTQARGAKMNDLAQGLIKDFQTLRAGGVDVNHEMTAMGPHLNDFVKQAKKAGVEIPSDMKTVLQTAIDSGVLFDDAGNKIKDMSELGLTFGETFTKQLGDVTTAINHLADVLSKGLTNAIVNVPDINIDANINGHWNIPDLPRDGGGVAMAEGGVGHITKPTWFLAGEKPGGEDFAFSGVGKRFDFGKMGGAGAGVTMENHFDFSGSILRDSDAMHELADKMATILHDKVRTVSQLSLRRST